MSYVNLCSILLQVVQHIPLQVQFRLEQRVTIARYQLHDLGGVLSHWVQAVVLSVLVAHERDHKALHSGILNKFLANKSDGDLISTPAQDYGCFT